MDSNELVQTVRRETEALIGRLVMANTTLTAQVNALTDDVLTLTKARDDANKALTPSPPAPAVREVAAVKPRR